MWRQWADDLGFTIYDLEYGEIRQLRGACSHGKKLATGSNGKVCRLQTTKNVD